MRRIDGKSAGAQGKEVKKLRPMKVYLSENAFMGLLLSSAEVFTKESLGYLLGYRLNDRFIVEYAYSLQTARRQRRGVMFHSRNQKKIESIIDNFVKLQIIGDFHSHTSYGKSRGIAVPSPEDIQEMKEDNLYIIIAVNKTRAVRRWKENSDGSITGSMGEFFFKISAYSCSRALAKPRKAPIFCPFPPGLKVG